MPMTAPVSRHPSTASGHGQSALGEQHGQHGSRGPRCEAGRQVDLPEQQDEHQAHRDDDDRGALVEEVGEVERRREGVGPHDREEGDEHEEAQYGGQGADVAAADLRHVGADGAADGELVQRAGSGRPARSRWCSSMTLLNGRSGCRPKSPLRPVVISSTTCECVTSAAFTWAAIRPRYERRRSGRRPAKTSFMLCEIRTTASPLSASRRTRFEHLLGLGDAERGGRLVEDDDLAVPEHRPGDRDGLPLAAGQAGDVLCGPT